jgi:hypothetical protein
MSLACEWSDDADYCLTCGTSIREACPYSLKAESPYCRHGFEKSEMCFARPDGSCDLDGHPYRRSDQALRDIINLDCAASEVYSRCWTKIAAVLFGEKDWL